MTVTETPQHLQALANANRVRFARSALKGSLRSMTREQGFAAVVTLLEAPSIPKDLEGMRLRDLVASIHRVGPKLTSRWLAAWGVGYDRRLGALPRRQRDELALMLRQVAALHRDR